MSFQIMHAFGVQVPVDFTDHKTLREALDILRLARENNVKILSPKDFWCRNKYNPKQLRIFPSHEILDGEIFFKLTNSLFYSANKFDPY